MAKFPLKDWLTGYILERCIRASATPTTYGLSPDVYNEDGMEATEPENKDE